MRLNEPVEKAGDWRTLVPGMSNVQRLVHLIMRKVEEDTEAMAAELAKARRRAYEDELTIQLRRTGCAKRRGMLTEGAALAEMTAQSKIEAEGITNTYNWEMGKQIMAIRRRLPPANRFVYAKRLRDWDAKRAPAKARQIAQWTEGTARARAQRDFARRNALEGTARLTPRRAKEPVCQGWINRGTVPLQEAMDNPGPFHPNCPHMWVTKPKRVPKGDCGELWGGE